MDDNPFATLARQATFRTIKSTARRYHKRPMTMEAIYPSLSMASADKLVAIGESMVERERNTPRRFVGFGGEVTLMNALAVRLVGRYERRFGERAMRRAA